MLVGEDNEAGNVQITCGNVVIHLMKTMKPGKGTDSDLGPSIRQGSQGQLNKQIK